MMYSNGFAAAIMCNGQFVKELANGEVRLPFGEEYSIRLHNKNDRHAKVCITIDGENVTSDGLVIPPHGHTDLKRPLTHDAAFKFAALDSVDAHLAGKDGDNLDKIKGTISAKFYLQVKPEPAKIVEHIHHHHHDYPWVQPWKPYRPFYGTITCSNASVSNSMKTRSAGSGQSLDFVETSYCTQDSVPDNVVQDGCTVDGTSTGQQFRTVYMDFETTFTELKMFLRGYDADAVRQVEGYIEEGRKMERFVHNATSSLEAENARLRKQIDALKNPKKKVKSAAQIENERLTKELEALRMQSQTV